MKVRYTWSRYAHNPVEHAFDDADQFARPLCGAQLNTHYQHIADQPSGLARLCQPCQDKLKKVQP